MPIRLAKKSRRRWLKNIFQSDQQDKKPDYILVGVVVFIVIFGLAMLSSASSVESFRDFGSTYYLFFHQLLNGLLPGVIFFIILSKIDYRRWKKFTLLFFILAVILLILVFIPGLGASYGRANSWINIIGLSFQPSEIVKLLLILGLAGWFSQRGAEMNKNFWNGLVPFTVIMALISLPIMKQPDYGSLFVIASIALVVYFIAGASLIHFFGLILTGFGLFGILIAQAPYRAERFMTFLHPELDPQGIGYHVNQAFLAIGSGGWFGLGFGQSRQKFAYLPELMGDSIFAIIAEEIGFVFSSLLIILFLVLLFRGIKIAQALSDDYGRYLTIGIITWFTLQAFLNIAGMIGLMPLTGIPLPFISYGGTALMSNLAAAGILVNISKNV